MLFYFCVIYSLGIRRKEHKIRGYFCHLLLAVNVMLKFSIVLYVMKPFLCFPADFNTNGNCNCFFFQFYAPWCGYCKKLEPIWAEVGRTLHGSSIIVAKLDATRFSGMEKFTINQSISSCLLARK